MKTPLAAAMLILLPAAALAGPCDADLAKLDAALQSPQVPPEQKAQATDMRQQAANLCAAGNEAEARDVLAEAEAMLGME